MSVVMGIDPGINGAIAVIDTSNWTLAVTDMPREPGKGGKNQVSPSGVARAMDAIAPDYSFIEDVWSSPQMGVVSAFNFGRNLGILEGACASRSMITKVRPQLWKSATSTPRDKNEARRRAMQVFPCAHDLFVRVKDDGRAEACMLAMYGLLHALKTPPPVPLVLVEFPTL